MRACPRPSRTRPLRTIGSSQTSRVHVPGLGAAGATRKEVERLIHEAIELHAESLREHGEPVPPTTSAAGTIAVGAA